ncbi:MAG: TonB-dependent receptor [Pseudomonadota bacterium]
MNSLSHSIRSILLASAGSIMALNGAVPSAAAQEDESAGLDTIIVTATKTEQDLQDVPVSLSAIDGDRLELIKGAGDDPLFLSGRVPSLNIETSFGRIFPRPSIRGLGNTDFDFNASQPVSYIYDEVIYENPVLKGFPVFDLERVEVLRGPQGTLFGRNTPAGILKFESVKPGDEFDAYVNASYANFNTLQVQGAVGAPVAEWLSVRLSAQYQYRDDYIENQIDDDPRADAGAYEDFAWRAQFLATPTDNLSWLLNFHGRSLDNGQTSFQANAFEPGSNAVRPGFDRRQTFADAQRFSELETNTFGVTSRMEGTFGAVKATYIFGYEMAEAFSRGDVDGGFGAAFLPSGGGPGLIPFPAESADGIDNLDQFTHEIRFSNADEGVFNWTLGAYFFDEELEISSFNFDTLANGAPNGEAFQEQDTNSWAIFASGNYQVTDQFTVSAGVRYTDDSKDFTAIRTIAPFVGAAGALGPIDVEVGDTNVSFDVSGTYAFNDDVNLYARVARGFRAPSIQGRILFGDAVTTADSEVILSFEGGVKSTLADNRVRANLNAYYFTIDDQQLTAIGGAGNFNQLLNADQGIGYGLEAELDVAVTDNLTVSSNFSWNETEIQDETLTTAPCGSATPCTVLDPLDADGNALIDGNPFPQAPRFIANIVVSYAQPFAGGELFGTTDWSYRSSANIFLYESIEFETEPQVIGGVKAGFRKGNWQIAGFARNITDTVGTVSAIDFNNLSGIFNQPRTYGVEIGWAY